MRLRIAHVTEYSFDQTRGYALQQIRMCPKARANQRVVEWRIDIEGGRRQADFTDQHYNETSLISVGEGRDRVRIEASGVVETSETHGVIGASQGFAPLWLYLRSTPLTEPGPAVEALVREAAGLDAKDALARLHGLSSLIAARIAYEIGRTDATTTAEQALTAGHGVCQDHAHVFLAAARLMGVPARYAGGFLMMNDRIDQEAGHAWAEAYVDGLGWVGFDVSNNISPDARYVCVATGLDYLEAAPVSGMTFGKSGGSLSVSVQVQQQ